jgi:hypothetical protein
MRGWPDTKTRARIEVGQAANWLARGGAVRENGA